MSPLSRIRTRARIILAVAFTLIVPFTFDENWQRMDKDAVLVVEGGMNNLNRKTDLC